MLSASFTGKAEAGGRMHVTLCDYIMPWDSLSNTQKKGLSQRYQMGCECKVRAAEDCLSDLSPPGDETRRQTHGLVDLKQFFDGMFFSVLYIYDHFMGSTILFNDIMSIRGAGRRNFLVESSAV